MKVRKKEHVLHANKIFTDREEPRKSFWKKYNLVSENTLKNTGDITVLSYYGIGGIGKSTLLKEIIRELSEKKPKSKYVYYDFAIKQESSSVLENLRNILSRDYNFKFPLFELGLYNYAQKSGEDMSSPEIQSFIEKSPLLDLLLNIAGEIPVVGFIPKLIGFADKGIAITKNMIDNHKNELITIENSTPIELYRKLPYLFAMDMTDNLKNENNPFVFFLDTYEQLVNEMSLIGEPLINDEWIRGDSGLIQNIPNVLWVVAGREKLKWEKFDIEWNSSLEQHILGELSPSDGINFLMSAGISNNNLCKELYSLTNGTPVYLDLCVDRYFDLIDAGITPSIDDFGSNIFTLVERFVRYMDDYKKEIIYILSILQVWDDEIAIYICSKVINNFSVLIYEKVKQFSFISLGIDERYCIHKTISLILRTECNEDFKNNVLKYAIDFCEKKLINENTMFTDYDFYLLWLTTYIIELSKENIKKETIEISIVKRTDELLNRGNFETPQLIFEKILESGYIIENSILHLYILNNYSNVLKKAGKYESALQYAIYVEKNYINLYNDDIIIKSTYSLDTILLMRLCGDYYNALNKIDNLLICLDINDLKNKDIELYYEIQNTRLKLLDNVSKNKESLSCGYKLYEEALRDFNEKEDICLQILRGISNSERVLGNYKKEYEIDKYIYNVYVEKYGNTDLESITALYNLGHSTADIGNFKEAIAIFKTVYDFRKEIYGTEHPMTINVYSKLGLMMQKVGEYKKSREILEDVYNKRKVILGELHPTTLGSLNNLVNIMNRTGDYVKILELRKKLYYDYCKKFGENHYRTLKVLNNLANALHINGMYKSCQEARYKVMIERENVLGPSHIDTLLSMSNYADSLSEFGKIKEADEIYEKSYSISRKIYGSEDINTISLEFDYVLSKEELGMYKNIIEEKKSIYNRSLNSLGIENLRVLRRYESIGDSLDDLGDFQGALKIYEEVFQKKIKLVGENDPSTLNTLSKIASIYIKLGRFDEALEIEEKILSVYSKTIGTDHIKSLITLNSIAWIKYNIGCYNEALEIINKVFNSLDLNELKPSLLCDFLDTKILILIVLDKKEDLLLCANRLYDIINQVYDYQTFFVSKRFITLAKAYKHSENKIKYNECKELAYKSLKSMFGDNHYKTIEALSI